MPFNLTIYVEEFLQRFRSTRNWAEACNLHIRNLQFYWHLHVFRYFFLPSYIYIFIIVTRATTGCCCWIPFSSPTTPVRRRLLIAIRRKRQRWVGGGKLKPVDSHVNRMLSHCGTHLPLEIEIQWGNMKYFYVLIWSQKDVSVVLGIRHVLPHPELGF